MKARRMKAGLMACVVLLVAALPTTAGGAAPRATHAPQPAIAITFDDIPAHGPLPPGVSRVDVIRDLSRALRAAKAPAFGFFNGGFAAGDRDGPAAAAAWVAAGWPLGNHSYSHGNLVTLGAPAFAADVIRNEAPLAAITGRKGDAEARHWFRYPFLSEGSADTREATRAMLRARGYRVAAVTMGFGDFLWNPPYAACAAKNDKAGIAALEASFLADARSAALAARAAAKARVGRDIPYVLLMHVGAFDARMLPRLLALYRSLGFRFITLEEAERDPFYAAATDLSLPGPSPSLPTPALPGPPAGLCA